MFSRGCWWSESSTVRQSRQLRLLNRFCDVELEFVSGECSGTGGAPQVLGVCEVPPAFLMEYCQGRTFQDLCWDPEVSNKTMMEVALQVMHQVAELHKRGFAHNDIKTDNCIANISHTPFSVHLIDFGNSTRLGESPMYRLDPEGSHIAPELCRSGNSSTATDAFSLGCLLADLMVARAEDKFPQIVSSLVQCAGREDPK
ncbi:serine/threonine-protein kinase nekl-2-like [Penaeus monodon]|uniref:serine/threonine-protein kinase nekl-2-like n=1 Tax=Penaeus monodon TaxID=6687 RepID=UPI0018A78B7E|nr:serine/threonine-protein kinase nekl-2-like [Penaeus monodon]